MYKLFIRFSSGIETVKDYTEIELRKLFDIGVKGSISWATVITPSETTKDVTRILSKS